MAICCKVVFKLQKETKYSINIAYTTKYYSYIMEMYYDYRAMKK